MISDPGIGWYVHLPFCTTKCGYCDFYSLPTRPDAIPDLARAVVREMHERDPRRPIRTLFVGGGTPTVLPADALQSILAELTDRLARHGVGDVEFTCEANPSTADELKLGLLRAAGVSRVSFGAQSFDPAELRVLERLHDPTHIAEAVHLARDAGFDNLNLDLIYAIPGQTLESWRRSLHCALALEPEHISCYALTYEDGTAMTKQLRAGEIRACDESLEIEMFHATIDVLAAAGYEQYEISNFARPGRACRHNLLYWNNEEYIGIGPSAVSYLDGRRSKNKPDVHAYLRAFAEPDGRNLLSELPPIVSETESLDAEHRARETAIQMLRLTTGIDVERFRRTTDYDPHELFAGAIEEHARAGLLTSDAAHIRLTRSGLLLANRVMADFV